LKAQRAHASKANPMFYWFLLGLTYDKILLTFYLKLFQKKFKSVFWDIYLFQFNRVYMLLVFRRLFFLLTKPFLVFSYSGFICTQLTEALSTYVTISLISCFYFLFPFISHQIWCFSIPSCYEKQKKKYNFFFT